MSHYYTPYFTELCLGIRISKEVCVNMYPKELVNFSFRGHS
jgi:hypothetical protein